MATKDEMLKAQHNTIQKLQRERREHAGRFEIMRMQNYEYKTMIMQLLAAVESIDEADDMPAYEYGRFVRSKVADTLKQFGHASTFAHQAKDEPPPLELIEIDIDDK